MPDGAGTGGSIDVPGDAAAALRFSASKASLLFALTDAAADDVDGESAALDDAERVPTSPGCGPIGLCSETGTPGNPPGAIAARLRLARPALPPRPRWLPLDTRPLIPVALPRM